VTHKNCVAGTCAPLGQNYWVTTNACLVTGTPGTASTYTVEMANAARAAFPTAGTDTSGTCGPTNESVVARQTASECIIWQYTGANAGAVRVTPIVGGVVNCYCPNDLSTTWN
jgi:hypothetical protein